MYKEIYKLLPEKTAKEKLPSEIFESVKNEVEEERKKDESLFSLSLTKKNEELEKVLSSNEKRKYIVSQQVESVTAQKNKVIEKYKAKVEAIKAKRVSQEQIDAQISSLRRVHRTELNKLNRSLTKHGNELASLLSESEMIVSQKDFIQSIQDSNLEGSNGLCRINLKWNTADDLDLHLVLPGGNIDSDKDIYFSHMRAEYNGGVCSLDHDAIPTNAGENPQENIVWEQGLPDGQYRVKVKLYYKKSTFNNIPFSITAFAGKYVKT